MAPRGGLLPGELGYLEARMNHAPYDVAIIGGGPAGSTAATLLARAGRRVLVCERDKFPRFHIGESLLPASMRLFERLGVSEKFQRAGFMEKFGGEMSSSCSPDAVRFYFEDGFQSQRDRAWQVTRADFDKLLLDHAAESGADVREETAVTGVSFDADGVALQLAPKDGAPTEVRARYLIDASGRQSVVGSLFQLKQAYDGLQKFSIFAHFDGAERPAGRDGTLTRMVRSSDRWFWLIPLTKDRTSIGVVLDTETFRRAKQSPEQFFSNALQEVPMIAHAIRHAERVTPVYNAADFSYRNRQLVGERWLLAGDAAGFIDPVFSSGVFLALMAGELAADALDRVLDRPKLARSLFARYERRVLYAMHVYLRFVRSWYKKEFIEVFLHPQDVLQIPPAVNAVLGGNIRGSFGIRWRMAVFYFIVWLQKYIPLCPRRTLKPKPNSVSAQPATATALS